MRKIVLLLAILTFTASTGYAQTDGVVSPAGDVSTDAHVTEITEEYMVYGEPMPDILEKFRLGEAIQKFDQVRGMEMQLTGIAQKCPGDDCWVILTDGGQKAKVILLDDRLTVSTDVTGKEITVFGMLEEFLPENPDQAKTQGDAIPREFHIISRSVRVPR
ncbi:MAG: hypothetical protein JXA28_03020 [Bacteroidetes bacterium]|nr:hypothetical protein [Bacteroidota bacterium]